MITTRTRGLARIGRGTGGFGGHVSSLTIKVKKWFMRLSSSFEPAAIFDPLLWNTTTGHNMDPFFFFSFFPCLWGLFWTLVSLDSILNLRERKVSRATIPLEYYLSLSLFPTFFHCLCSSLHRDGFKKLFLWIIEKKKNSDILFF